MNIRSTLGDAASKFGSDEATLDTRLLLQHLLNVNHAWLIAHAEDTLTTEQSAAFEALLQRRLSGEPIAHILGSREFFGLNLKVTADTLIPRPDTETLVEAALEKASLILRLAQDTRHHKGTALLADRPELVEGRGNDGISDISDTLQPLNMLDLGTGTGAIALALAKHCPQANITAVDFSENALNIARENAKNLAIQNVAFVHSHWFSALNQQRFHIIVSNPPYIAENDPHLSQGDVRFEPKSALTSGADGLDDIRHIIGQASQHLVPNGWLLLEHGYDQAEAVAKLLAEAGFTEIAHAQDLAGIQRVTFGMVSPMISTQSPE